MTVRQRLVVLLAQAQGWPSYAELSLALGCNESAVRVAVWQLRSKGHEVVIRGSTARRGPRKRT